MFTAMSKYQRLSTRDMLSGILNKRSWEAAVQDYLAECQPNVSCALLVLDIDNFKGINDRFGHYTGDEFLHFVGESLLGIFRVSDLVGRFGGDEFVVLIQGAVSQEALEEKCSLIQARFAQAPLEATVSCSIGGTLVREQPVEFVSLFRQADRALYAAKRAGKARFVLHDYQ